MCQILSRGSFSARVKKTSKNTTHKHKQIKIHNHHSRPWQLSLAGGRNVKKNTNTRTVYHTAYKDTSADRSTWTQSIYIDKDIKTFIEDLTALQLFDVLSLQPISC